MELIEKARKFKWPKSPRPENWIEEQVFFDSDTYFTDILQGLVRARASVRMEMYIFEPGILAGRIVNALVAASYRGVAVQLMVDRVGSPYFWREYGERLTEAGIQVRIFRSYRNWLSINRGNHRKTCLIDDEVAWIGSQNVDDRHLREVHGEKAWVDAGVRIRGPELDRLKQAFQATFMGTFLHQRPFRQSRDSLLLFNNSLVLRQSTKILRVRRLRKAKELIWLQTPYFVPIRRIYRALIRQARRGRDVRIIIPYNSDVPFLRPLTYSFFATLLKAGVKIYEFGPRFAHQKIYHIDGWTTVGTSNLNHRSFKHDFEVDVVITREENLRLLRERFLADQAQSRMVSMADLAKISIWQRVYSRILFFFRYWV
jgi:cardiolipin synthase A/B